MIVRSFPIYIDSLGVIIEKKSEIEQWCAQDMFSEHFPHSLPKKRLQMNQFTNVGAAAAMEGFLAETLTYEHDEETKGQT